MAPNLPPLPEVPREVSLRISAFYACMTNLTNLCVCRVRVRAHARRPARATRTWRAWWEVPQVPKVSPAGAKPPAWPDPATHRASAEKGFSRPKNFSDGHRAAHDPPRSPPIQSKASPVASPGV
jgi:hypothetical protein